ncbi:MAG: hypothetical protein VYB54_08575 [Pseudomonadota bacterium]|nr:hypothetical protein [Pseudomonadota bacterium]
MDDIDYWRLADELTIVQAALLVVGESPGPIAEYVEKWDAGERPPGYEAAKHAIKNALLNGRVKGSPVEETAVDWNGNEIGVVPGTAEIHHSLVDVLSLRNWLSDRGFRDGFFFPEKAGKPDYLDANNGRYAPKLAAAVGAWLAIGNTDDLKGRHPKQALMKWLRENAASYGLTDDEGKPMETTLGEIAKIANWQPKGGAPKTPGQDIGNDTDTESTANDLDSPIPF